MVAISGMGQTSKGTPRLITKDNHFITANVNFVNPTELQRKMDTFLLFLKELEY